MHIALARVARCAVDDGDPVIKGGRWLNPNPRDTYMWK